MNDTWQNNVIFVSFNRSPKKPLEPTNGAAVWLDDEWEELEGAEGSLEDEESDEPELDFVWLDPEENEEEELI